MTFTKARNEQMWRASAVLAGLTAVSGIIGTVAFIVKAPALVTPTLSVLVVGLVTGFALLICGAGTPVPLSVGSFLLNTFVVLGGVWFNHRYFFHSGQLIEPFAGDKLLSLAMGLIAPPILWVGLLAIIASGIAPMAQYYMLPSEIRHALPFQEPWMTYMYIAVAVIMYVFRLKWYEAQMRAARVEAQAVLLQQFAHLLINAQHLTNTPLQTLENSVAIFRMQHPEDAEQAATMKRALERMRDVVRLFSYCDSYINWQEMELPKSVEEFEKRMKDLISKAFV